MRETDNQVHKSQRQLVPWTSLKEQFGPDFQRIRKFRETFMDALRQVHVVYPAAKIEVHGRGLFLHTSPPPVVKTGVLIRLPDKTALAGSRSLEGDFHLSEG